MTNDRLFILDESKAERPATRREFVKFWAGEYPIPYDAPYAKNILGPHTEETLDALWLWKVGREGLFKYQRKICLLPNFISKLEKAAGEPHSPKEFLEEFPNGGPIYRIFWQHCWYPDRPIYDQHAHRAMTYIRDGTLDELGKRKRQVIGLYIEHYLPFYEQFAEIELPFDPKVDGVRGRKADRALVTFGAYIKGSRHGAVLPKCSSHELGAGLTIAKRMRPLIAFVGRSDPKVVGNPG